MSEQSLWLADVQKLAESVFENCKNAQRWLAAPNGALAGSSPRAMCATGEGAQQVMRVLYAIEYGRVV